MYFHDRAQAAQQLIPPLLRYRFENSVVVALSENSVPLAEQISASLHCILTLFLALDIEVPGESVTYGSVSEGGSFNTNSELSRSELDDYYSEFRGYIEEQKRTQSSQVNRLLGDGGVMAPEMLRDHVVIMVADGMKSGAILDAVSEYLKPIRIQRLIIATPIASVSAVDKMHILADELHVLNVTDNMISVDHYYDENKHLTHDEIMEKLHKIILNWR